MKNNMIAGLAGALLLSTAGFAFAAQGTTVVPAGQDASSVKMAQAETPAADAPAAADPSAAETSAPATSDAAPADAGGASVAGISNPEPDAHPSADTQAETNKVASINPNDASEDPGLALDTAEKPVYAFAEDGTADWYTWRGYKKYGANCLQCHGPDGMGSSFAPNLTESIQKIDYYEFAGIIVGGQQNKWSPSGNSIMPAWGEDPNVMCSLNAIYTYLRGRTDGAVGRGEPKRPGKTDVAKAAQQKEYDCLGF